MADKTFRHLKAR